MERICEVRIADAKEIDCGQMTGECPGPREMSARVEYKNSKLQISFTADDG